MLISFTPYFSNWDINLCKIDELPTFDIEYLFLNIRSRSIGESIDLIVTCPDDGETKVNKQIYIDEISIKKDKDHNPDLSLLKKASSMVGEHLNKDNIVIYESTVYPGATEEICVPLLEKYSGLKYNKDFFCSYSPERINPGDKKNNINNIVKLVSSSSNESLKKIAKIYRSIIKAKVFKCSSIKVAEAAKIIENTQRDLNISLMNEFSIICRN